MNEDIKALKAVINEKSTENERLINQNIDLEHKMVSHNT
jgi:hypothetical protein